MGYVRYMTIPWPPTDPKEYADWRQTHFKTEAEFDVWRKANWFERPFGCLCVGADGESNRFIRKPVNNTKCLFHQRVEAAR
jgi:hypothetical protein